MTSEDILERLGLTAAALSGGSLVARSPIAGATTAHPRETPDGGSRDIGRAHQAYLDWRTIPAPRRGELVRLFGEELRAAKAELGRLVTLEVGKVVSEGLGEVQEMIDICDFAVGLSRQLYGLTIASERPDHRMMRPGGRWASASFPPSTSRSPSGPGTRRWRWSAATPWCGSRRRKRR